MAKELPFRTTTSPRVIIETNPGSKMEDVWALRLTDTGQEEYYIKGQTNIYERIQMFRDECDLEQILIRCTQTGDFSLLNSKQPLYADFEDMPDNIFDAHRKIKQAQETFLNLPLNIREEYDNNFDKFLAEIGTDKWIQTFEKLKPQESPIKETPEKGETTE